MQEAAFRHLVSSLHDGVLVIRKPERRTTWANPAAAQIFGRTIEALVGSETACLHVDDEHFQRFRHLSLPALERGERFETNYTMRRASGEVFPARIAVARFVDDDGCAYAVSVIRDISAETALARALADSE